MWRGGLDYLTGDFSNIFCPIPRAAGAVVYPVSPYSNLRAELLFHRKELSLCISQSYFAWSQFVYVWYLRWVAIQLMFRHLANNMLRHTTGQHTTMS